MQYSADEAQRLYEKEFRKISKFSMNSMWKYYFVKNYNRLQ